MTHQWSMTSGHGMPRTENTGQWTVTTYQQTKTSGQWTKTTGQ